MIMKKSHRFLFLGADVEVAQTGPDSFQDVWTDPVNDDTGTATNLTGNVRITLPGQITSCETSVSWPSPGDGLVDLAPAVLEALDQVDPRQEDQTLRELRHAVEKYLAAVHDEGDTLGA